MRPRPHRLPARIPKGSRNLPPVHGGGGRPRRGLRRVPLGRARRRARPLGAAGEDVRARRRRPVRASQGGLRPRMPAQPGGARAARPHRRTSEKAGREADPLRRRLPVRRRRRRHGPGRPPLHRRGQLPGEQIRPRRLHVPLLRGHARREGRDPRQGEGAPGRGARRGAGVGLSRGARLPRSVPGMQGVFAGLPDGDRRRAVQIRGPLPRLPRKTQACGPLRPGKAAAVGEGGNEGSPRREDRERRDAGRPAAEAGLPAGRRRPAARDAGVRNPAFLSERRGPERA